MAKRRSSRRMAALDFDSRTLRVVHFRRRRGRVQLLQLTRVPMPGDLDLQSADAVGRFIRQTLGDLGLGGARVLMSVSRGLAVLKPLALPGSVPEGELAGMVQFQIAKELPFAPEEAVVDFAVEPHFDAAGPGGSGATTDVLVAAVRLPVVERYRQIAEVAGVGLERLGLRPYANRRCVETCIQRGPQERIVLVHVTPDETEIDIFGPDSLAFSRSAAVVIPPADAPAEANSQAVSGLVLEVMRSLQSYLAVHRGEQLDGVLVAGDTGLEADLAGALRTRLDARCEVFDPAGALGLRTEVAASGFIVPLGLAISDGADVAVGPFDFLNPKRPVVPRDTRQVKAVAAAVLVLLLLGTAVYAGWRHKAQAADDLRGVTNALKKASDDNARVKALAKSLDAIERWQEGKINWLAHWANVSSLFPAAPDAYVAGSLQADWSSAGEIGAISFRVRARNREVIDGLLTRLTEMGYAPQMDRVTPYQDAFNPEYTVETTVRLAVDPAHAVNLAELAPAPRPEDDASREMSLNRRGGR